MENPEYRTMRSGTTGAAEVVKESFITGPREGVGHPMTYANSGVGHSMSWGGAWWASVKSKMTSDQ